MFRNLFFSVWKRKFFLIMLLIQHAFRSRIFLIEIHICTSVLIVTITLQVWRLLIIRINTIKILWSRLLLVHFSCISSLIAISLIFLFLFILLIEVIHDIIIISITFFKDTLNHALSIGVLHRLLGSILHSIWVI